MVGQLGDGSSNSRPPPVQVKSISNVVAASAGNMYSLAIKADSSLRGWGYNSSDQVGDGSISDRLSPIQEVGLIGDIRVAAGFNHSLALLQDGSIGSWGRNDFAQLDDRTTNYNRSLAYPLTGPSGGLVIAGGDRQSLILKQVNLGYVWGSNGQGQLGLEEDPWSPQPPSWGA